MVNLIPPITINLQTKNQYKKNLETIKRIIAMIGFVSKVFENIVFKQKSEFVLHILSKINQTFKDNLAQKTV